MAAASRIISLSRSPRIVAIATAPPAEDAALLPSPLPGFVPFLMVIENPMSSQPQCSASLIAAYEAVFLEGLVGTLCFPTTLTSYLPLGIRLMDTRSLGDSKQSPNESKPGPKLAIVEGDDTTARSHLIQDTWLQVHAVLGY